MDSYIIDSEIGKGSFATVFKAKFIKTSAEVAIKVVSRKKLNRKLAENLELEIEILYKSRHRNVVLLYDVIKTTDDINLVMEFCALGDLSIFIKKKGLISGITIDCAGPWGGLDEFAVRYLLGQLSSAVEFLRLHQIIHRDLKPQNIMLASPPANPIFQALRLSDSVTDQKIAALPILKIGDFGFARALQSQSLASTLCGSPLYMAPEILRGDKYGAKSDLWSVGTILYEMICARPPFRAQNHVELLRKIDKGDGLIRFPDETNEFLTVEYHGESMRNTRAQIPIQQIRNSHIGILGSSPKMRHGKAGVSIVPEDLKILIRKLLKRNPIERMTFEEFFFQETIIECRKLDTRTLEINAESTIAKNIIDSIRHDSQRPVKNSESLITKCSNIPNEKLSNEARVDFDVPFPTYANNPLWMEKLIADTEMPILTVARSNPINDENNANIRDSVSSLGSILGSIDLASEEESTDHSTTKNLVELTQAVVKSKGDEIASQLDHSSNDFVVVESGHVEVKWNTEQESDNVDSTHPLTYVSQQFDRNYSTKSYIMDLPIPPIPSCYPPSLENLYLADDLNDSLENNPIKISSNKEIDPKELFDSLPYKLNIDKIQDTQQSILENLNLSASKALCVSELALQFVYQSKKYQEMDDIGNTKVATDEAIQVLLFELGLWQFTINRAKELFDGTSDYYADCLVTIYRFAISKFDQCLETTETLKSLHTPVIESKGPERIIYETALSTAKHAGILESKRANYQPVYKVAYLLLQALLQPCWKGDSLGLNDLKLIRNFSDQLARRMLLKKQ